MAATVPRPVAAQPRGPAAGGQGHSTRRRSFPKAAVVRRAGAIRPFRATPGKNDSASTDGGEYALGRLLQLGVDSGVNHPGFRSVLWQARCVIDQGIPGGNPWWSRLLPAAPRRVALRAGAPLRSEEIFVPEPPPAGIIDVHPGAENPESREPATQGIGGHRFVGGRLVADVPGVGAQREGLDYRRHASAPMADAGSPHFPIASPRYAACAAGIGGSRWTPHGRRPRGGQSSARQRGPASVRPN